jgi:phospholipase D1/2
MKQVLKKIKNSIESRHHEREVEKLQPPPPPQFLHGLLHIKVIRATGVLNKDGPARFLPKSLSHPLSKVWADVSDPFVVVYAPPVRLCKTSIKSNTLSPVWNEDFYVQICSHTTGILFKVKDFDEIGSDLLGDVAVSIEEITQCVSYQSYPRPPPKPVPTFLHRVSYISGNRRFGELEYVIEYMPRMFLYKNLDVPSVYFQASFCNSVRLYLNADDPPYISPWIPHLPQDMSWGRCWLDIYNSINDAKFFIYLTGWSFNVHICLVRDPQLPGHGETLGELLTRKAEEGLRVVVLLWNDATSFNQPFFRGGLMRTNDEETLLFFRKTNVMCKITKRLSDQHDRFHEGMAVPFLYSHHGKSIILDSTAKDFNVAQCSHDRMVKAFVGGLDITDGRFDDSRHSLFRTQKAGPHANDFYNRCFSVRQGKGPRQSWHDIHMCVVGPSALDVYQNFVERFLVDLPNDATKLVDLDSLGLKCLKNFNCLQSKNTKRWGVQVFRSIDERSAQFDHERVRLGSTYSSTHLTLNTQPLGEVMPIQNLSLKKGRLVDDSIHRAYVHHIRRAQRFIYIENQYFLGSSAEWDEKEGEHPLANNLIAAELARKICEKIETGERFAAYVVIPLFPEGAPNSGPVQEILHWQYCTISMMYSKIARALKENGRSNEHPRDYLNFYCLGNREKEYKAGLDEDLKLKKGKNKNDSLSSDEKTLGNSRRMSIYVHSKMMIVDDQVIIVGSANINDRSMSGTRDSEIACAAYQIRDTKNPTSEAVNNEDVAFFRLHIWCSYLSMYNQVFNSPESLECLRFVNELTRNSLLQFLSPEIKDMPCKMMMYPIKVGFDGTVGAHEDCVLIPDSNAPLLGKVSAQIPGMLTT